jgi:hypothetical protein
MANRAMRPFNLARLRFFDPGCSSRASAEKSVLSIYVRTFWHAAYRLHSGEWPEH